MIISVASTSILPSVKSDHSIIELCLRLDGPDRGPGLWKLNTSILNEPDYKTEIQSLIYKILEESLHISDVGVRFDWLNII